MSAMPNVRCKEGGTQGDEKACWNESWGAGGKCWDSCMYAESFKFTALFTYFTQLLWKPHDYNWNVDAIGWQWPLCARTSTDQRVTVSADWVGRRSSAGSYEWSRRSWRASRRASAGSARHRCWGHRRDRIDLRLAQALEHGDDSGSYLQYNEVYMYSQLPNIHDTRLTFGIRYSSSKD